MQVSLRPARREDAPDLARLMDMAGEGLPSWVWARMAEPGETPMQVGARRAAGDAGGFSWRNAVVAEVAGQVAGALVSYRVADEPEPLEALPPVFRPLQALENRVPGSYYVNAIATYPAFRRQGVGARLMAEAERQGAGAPGGLSLIVADRNLEARRLYEACGYVEIGREPLVREGWRSESEAWVLMVRR